jgi:glycosyltransferase involved in cell wall biosynthesis
MSRHFISVLTPTYNRRRFLQTAIACFKAQTYPQDRMEWIILDDGTDKVGDLFDPAKTGLKNVRYIALPEGEKLPIGAKRNRLNELAKGEIIVCWDDTIIIHRIVFARPLTSCALYRVAACPS